MPLQAIQARPRELEKLFLKRPRALCLRLTGSGIMSDILSTLLVEPTKVHDILRYVVSWSELMGNPTQGVNGYKECIK